MKCPNCQSEKVGERFIKETHLPVYDYACNECDCLFNDEEDFMV